MSVSINTITIGGIEDRRLNLSNSQAARVITIGTSWTRLRVGIRFAFDDYGANILTTPRLYLGAISSPSVGMANGPLTNATSHFVGLITATATWARNAPSPVWYNLATGSMYAKKINSTISTVAGTNVSVGVSGQPNLRRNIILVDILKGSPNFTITICMPSGVAITGDVTQSAHLAEAMSKSALTDAATYIASIETGSYVGNATGALAVDEGANGFLNAVCVAWDRSSPSLNISDLMWAKMA